MCIAVKELKAKNLRQHSIEEVRGQRLPINPKSLKAFRVVGAHQAQQLSERNTGQILGGQNARPREFRARTWYLHVRVIARQLVHTRKITQFVFEVEFLVHPTTKLVDRLGRGDN